METELSNIVPESKLNKKLLNNNTSKIDKNNRRQYRELDKAEQNINKYKPNLKNKNINYSKSNCLSKLFFFWARSALQKSKKKNPYTIRCL